MFASFFKIWFIDFFSINIFKSILHPLNSQILEHEHWINKLFQIKVECSNTSIHKIDIPLFFTIKNLNEALIIERNIHLFKIW